MYHGYIPGGKSMDGHLPRTAWSPKHYNSPGVGSEESGGFHMVFCGRGCRPDPSGLVWLWFGLLGLFVVIFGAMAVAVPVVVLRICCGFGGGVRFDFRGSGWFCWEFLLLPGFCGVGCVSVVSAGGSGVLVVEVALGAVMPQVLRRALGEVALVAVMPQVLRRALAASG